MATFSISFHIQIMLISAFIFSLTLYISPVNSHPFKKIYAFGDSFTDTGNTRSMYFSLVPFTKVSNFPYGMTYFHVPTNRYSDGRLVIDFVADALKLPFLPPYLYLGNYDGNNGVNFAVGGATAISNDFYVKNNVKIGFTPQSLPNEINWFNNFLEKHGCVGSISSSSECEAVLEDALIWFGEIGANDYAYTSDSHISSDTVRELAINSTITALQVILSKGAKYIAVQSLPPIGCLSLTLTEKLHNQRDKFGCVKSENEKAKIHNQIYRSKLQDLKSQFRNATIVYIDYYNAYLTVLQNPGKYGLKEPFKACCGIGVPYHVSMLATCGVPFVPVCLNPSTYVNWDGVHLTEAMYHVLSDMFLVGTFSQPPFKTLLDSK